MTAQHSTPRVGEIYNLRFTLTTSQGVSAFATTELQTAAPPSLGVCTLQEDTVAADETAIVLCDGWVDTNPDGALTYRSRSCEQVVTTSSLFTTSAVVLSASGLSITQPLPLVDSSPSSRFPLPLLPYNPNQNVCITLARALLT